jgi:hypothetical protein
MSFILGIVDYMPGGSATEGFRSARSRRRRTRVAALASLGAAGACLVWWPRSSRYEAAGLLVLVAVIAWMWAGTMDAERWLRGAEGEVATARLLASLNPRRWTVMHDLPLPGSRANVDHLVIGPTGVWVVDTKTSRAPVRARFRTVTLGQRKLDVGPLLWEAEIVADRLDVDVRPLVAVHGAGLRRRGAKVGGVRVVPAGRVARRIRRGRHRLDRNEVARLTKLAAEQLSGKRWPVRV